MWFTRVSLQNPVFATMVMLALVVMGIFSFQRLKVDQFPNIDFPVVVITTEYPGASPEIVESEVSKKIEEGVNSIAGISSLISRSYENQSVVIMEFQLQIDGRKAAEDVREKVASLRPLLRTEVKEPRVLRFDPASRAVWSLAVIPEGNQLNAVELTNWSEQVLKKRLENVRGVGSVSLVGGSKREINLYLQPANMEALGVTAEHVPFQGAANVATAVLGRQVEIATTTFAESRRFVVGGEWRGLGVMSPQRLAAMPGLPTMREQGIAAEMGSIRGLGAPRATPAPILAAIAEAVGKMVQDPEYAAALEQASLPARYLPQAGYVELVANMDRDLKALWQTNPWRQG